MLQETILSILQDSKDFKDIEEKIFLMLRGLTLEITKDLLYAYDDGLKDNRDTKELRLEDTKKKIIQIIFGELELERRYYEDQEGNKKFLLDEMLGLPKNDRVSPVLKEIALQIVQDCSYSKTRDTIEKVAKQFVSHAAIHRWAQKTGTQIDQAEKNKSQELF